MRFCNLNCSSSVVFTKHWLEISQTSGIGCAHWCFLFRYNVCLAPDFELLFNSSFSDGYAIFTSNFDYHIFSYFQGHLISPKSWKTRTGDFHFAIYQKRNVLLVFSPPKKSNFWFLSVESWWITDLRRRRENQQDRFGPSVGYQISHFFLCFRFMFGILVIANLKTHESELK